MKAFQSGRLLTAVIVTLFSGGLGPEITAASSLPFLFRADEAAI
jgi:TRAP-type C4-dicarboxylate transport system substrate-binding protein